MISEIAHVFVRVSQLKDIRKCTNRTGMLKNEHYFLNENKKSLLEGQGSGKPPDRLLNSSAFM